MSELFDQIRDSTERAKSKREKMLSRFHVGEVVYPVYQLWRPIVWGTVTRIQPETGKVYVSLNGGEERQYAPEELLLSVPESKGSSSKKSSSVERKVKAAFSLRKAETEDLLEPIAPPSEREDSKIMPAYKPWKISMQRVAEIPDEVSTVFKSFICDTMNFILSADESLMEMDMNEFREDLINALYSFRTAYALSQKEPNLSEESKNLMKMASTHASAVSRAIGVII